MRKLNIPSVSCCNVCIFIYAFFIIFSLTPLTFAEDLQKFSVKNNATIIAVISENELSRFIFSEGKIKQIFAINGDLHYEISEESLYIKPNVNKPINFFISTVKGNTYKIIATPKDIPATQISIASEISGGKNSIVYPKYGFTGEAIFRNKISKIIKAARAGDQTIGYKVKEIGKSVGKKDGVRSYHDSRWSDGEVVADKYFLTNVSSHNIAFDKYDYLSEQIQAVYLDYNLLEPGRRAILITVRVLK